MGSTLDMRRRAGLGAGSGSGAALEAGSGSGSASSTGAWTVSIGAEGRDPVRTLGIRFLGPREGEDLAAGRGFGAARGLFCGSGSGWGSGASSGAGPASGIGALAPSTLGMPRRGLRAARAPAGFRSAAAGASVATRVPRTLGMPFRPVLTGGGAGWLVAPAGAATPPDGPRRLDSAGPAALRAWVTRPFSASTSPRPEAPAPPASDLRAETSPSFAEPAADWASCSISSKTWSLDLTFRAYSTTNRRNCPMNPPFRLAPHLRSTDQVLRGPHATGPPEPCRPAARGPWRGRMIRTTCPGAAGTAGSQGVTASQPRLPGEA
ncbi:MAG: hypothetical protein QOJ93_2106, partial [Actinomycetota bacterium]|nr:hypothetical protein [Actinomycetota bacterium]